MRRIALLIALCLAAPIASAQNYARSYWLLNDGQRHEWCGYSDPSAFQATAAKLRATQSAIVTYMLSRLTELTQQAVSDDGSWLVIDRYTPSRSAMLLQRTNILSRQNLRVVQAASIEGGKVAPLRTIGVTTIEGQPASAPANLTLPIVAVMSAPENAPYLLLVTQMRHESIPTLCRRVQ